MGIIVLQRIISKLVIDILLYPVWWYTIGLKRSALFTRDMIRLGNTSLAPGVWLKNIFVPMYGQRDLQGRLASFFMRSVNIVIRGGLFLLWLCACLCIIAFWIGAPLFILYMLVNSF